METFESNIEECTARALCKIPMKTNQYFQVLIEKNFHDLEKGEYIDGPQAKDESVMYQNLCDYSTIIEVN